MDTTFDALTADVLVAIDALADQWRTERVERFQRQHLEPDDFRALAETGFLRLIVPESHGGLFRSLTETGPVLVDAIARLARGDQSVALVSAMHPIMVAFWAAAPDAPEPFADAWTVQRAEVFQSVIDGHFWGTIASEPGSGGDVMRTKAVARSIDGSTSRYTIHGAKHFGSGSQQVSYMVTTAKPDDDDAPGIFYLDLRDQPWDGSAGVEITRRWDGMGMKATQSHAVMFDGVEGTAFAWPGALESVVPPASTLGLAMFCAVTLAVVDAAMAEAETRLSGKSLRPYEEVAWTEAQVQHWMLTQAQCGVATALSDSDITAAAKAILMAKRAWPRWPSRRSPRSVEPSEVAPFPHLRHSQLGTRMCVRSDSYARRGVWPSISSSRLGRSDGDAVK